MLLSLLQDFLGLVEKLFYLSGKYDIELTVGDAAMVINASSLFLTFTAYYLSVIFSSSISMFQENSFSQALGHIDLDLPEVPEKATRPPPQAVDPYSRFGPMPEISHIFRPQEKRPSQQLSYAFSGLVFVPFLAFLIGVSPLFIIPRYNSLYWITVSVWHAIGLRL